MSETASNVMALCLENGWKCVERSSDCWMVEMEGTPSFCQAELSVQGSVLQMAVTLADWEVLAPTSAEAIMNLLCAASGTFKMVRAVIGAKNRALLLAQLELTEVGAELETALCALSLAARLMQRELKALQNPTLAEEYLARTTPRLASNAGPTTQSVDETKTKP